MTDVEKKLQQHSFLKQVTCFLLSPGFKIDVVILYKINLSSEYHNFIYEFLVYYPLFFHS